MELTETQKRIIRKIHEQKIYDSFTYLKNEYPQLLTAIERSRIESGRMKIKAADTRKVLKDEKIIVNHRSKYFFTVSDVNTLKEALVEFLSLIRTLDSEGLILKMHDPILVNPVYYINQEIANIEDWQDYDWNHVLQHQHIMTCFFFNEPSNGTNTLFKLHLYPTLNLDAFINNGFLTKSELHNKRNTIHARISIIVAVITALLSFGISIYSTNQSVTSGSASSIIFAQHQKKISRAVNNIEKILHELAQKEKYTQKDSGKD